MALAVIRHFWGVIFWASQAAEKRGASSFNRTLTWACSLAGCQMASSVGWCGAGPSLFTVKVDRAQGVVKVQVA